MAITYVAGTSDAQVSNSFTIAVPSGTVNDDFMFLVVDTIVGSFNWSTPSGWTLIDTYQETAGADISSVIYRRKASSEPANYTVSHDGSSQRSSALIVSYRGVDTTTPLDVVFSSGTHRVNVVNDNTPDPQSITTLTDDARVAVFSVITHDDITAAVASTNYTLRQTILFTDDSDADDCQILSQDREIATAGAEDPGAWNNTDNGTNAAESVTYTFAMRPAAGGGATNPKGPFTHPFNGPFRGPIS